MSEPELVKQRYQRREERDADHYYNRLLPSVYLSVQERQRAIIRLFNNNTISPVSEKKVLEIGCGAGSNLLELVTLGFSPKNLVGNELLEERVARARERLPQAIQVLAGDASTLNLEPQSFDIVYQSTVFTSILDDAFQQKLADQMWTLLRPGGGILWYDFTFNNPNNPDVRGVSLSRVASLFPEGKLQSKRVTLAPPLSRRVTKIHPSLYNICNTLPFLRTHLLCWIEKPK